MTRRRARGQVPAVRTRRAAVVVALVAALVLFGGVRLWLATDRLVHSDQYLPGVYSGPYAAGSMEPDGHGVYLPSALLVGLGLVLARFAFSLWQDKPPYRRSPQPMTPSQHLAGTVLAVHRHADHRFSKSAVPEIELVQGHGVRGDAHFGTTVQHRSRVARDPSQPNLRQVHLLQQELLDEVQGLGLDVAAGQLGENITTQGLDVLALAVGTRLRLGRDAVVEVTGLRNPCAQIESFRSGLLAAVLGRAPDGSPVRKAGVMAIVCRGGVVRPGDALTVDHRPAVHQPLRPV